jgi:hypothetical protein
MTILEQRGRFWWRDEGRQNTAKVPEDAISGLLKINEQGRINLELYGRLPALAKGPPPAIFDSNPPSLKGAQIHGYLTEEHKFVALTDLAIVGSLSCD